MLTTKLISIAFAVLILFPVGFTFYKMCRFELPGESEEVSDDLPRPESIDGSKPAYAVMVSQVFYIVSPFDRLITFLNYGPRRWVGITGITLTVGVCLLLVYSAWFPVPGPSRTYEWTEETDDLPESVDSDSVIHWDSFDQKE